MAPEEELSQPAHQLPCKEVHVLGSVAAAVISEAHEHMGQYGRFSPDVAKEDKENWEKLS